ncbi:anti-sigma factor [Aquisphaera insulae]|uniref:anti-sigma factor n=1 Tax=Aquisphaera insulae TaxID=2712864 RepID=UPI0013EC0DD6|nr:anti-sigma factor [Aquisphaera insulae]
MIHDKWLESADLYALGALDGEELSRFEDHIDSGCEECERQVREAREALLLLPRSLPESTGPSPGVKRRLMAQVAAESSGPSQLEPRPRPRRGIHWGRVGLSAAAALLIGLAGLAAWDDWNLRGQLRDLAAEAAQLRTSLVQRKDVIRYMEDPEVAIVILAGLPPSPKASGRVLWRAADRTGFILARGLPPAPSGKKYAVWAIGPSGPVLAGQFTDEEIRRAPFRLPPPGTTTEPAYREFAVTLEPASAGPRPTGPMHLQGTLAALARRRDRVGVPWTPRLAMAPPRQGQRSRCREWQSVHPLDMTANASSAARAAVGSG